MAILGLPSLRKKLKRLPPLAEQEIRKAMEAGANEMVALAKSLAASDRVRNSIAWTYGDAPKGAIALGGVQSSSGNIRITVYAGGDEAFMARWEEFGTSPHVNAGIFAGTQHPGTKARPFFFVSFRALRRRMKSRITRSINKSAKRAAAGG